MLLEIRLKIGQKVVLVDYVGEAGNPALVVIEAYVELGDIVVAYFALPVGDHLVVLAVLLRDQFHQWLRYLSLPSAELLVQVGLFRALVRYAPDQRHGLGDLTAGQLLL